MTDKPIYLKMRCQNITNTVTEYGCAFFCEKKNNPPIPLFIYDNFRLIEKSYFFDSGVFNGRTYKWSIYIDDVYCDSFGYEKAKEPITQLNNNSSYGSINLGKNNLNIVNYINSLPNYTLTKKNNVKIKLDVIDCDGIKNVAMSNTYSFNITK